MLFVRVYNCCRMLQAILLLLVALGDGQIFEGESNLLFPSPVFEHYCSIVDLYAGIVTNTSMLDYGMNTRTGTAQKYLE